MATELGLFSPLSYLKTDFSGSGLTQSSCEEQLSHIKEARNRLADIEAGAVANIDEDRLVGHFWLRDPGLAPESAMRSAIQGGIDSVREFADSFSRGRVVGGAGTPLRHCCLIGIGGSSLGPMLLQSAIRKSTPNISFIDNIDPEGITRTIERLPCPLSECLVVVASKSGGTTETRVAEHIVEQLYNEQGLRFAEHAVSITQPGSALFERSRDWVTSFPIWDWVGGRTSIWSAVGLLPLTLCGGDVERFLDGAAELDRYCRGVDASRDPAALLALSWLGAAQSGRNNFVVLPYSDRMELLSRYLQQLVMESLGKGLTRDGESCAEGISVFGNKGSTDQHAFVQQLRDGRDDFLCCFIEILDGAWGATLEGADFSFQGSSARDYLAGFLHGTRRALGDAGRASIYIGLDSISEQSLGALLALFERAVALYAEMRNINAYHQPGVEAGKQAAAEFLVLQRRVQELISTQAMAETTFGELVASVGESADPLIVVAILERLRLSGSTQSGPIVKKLLHQAYNYGATQ